MLNIRNFRTKDVAVPVARWAARRYRNRVPDAPHIRSKVRYFGNACRFAMQYQMYMHEAMVAGVLSESPAGFAIFFDCAGMKLYINGPLDADAEIIVRRAGFGFRIWGPCVLST